MFGLVPEVETAHIGMFLVVGSHVKERCIRYDLRTHCGIQVVSDVCLV